MPDFFTRVELHGGKAADYEILHEAMKDRGFYRAIRGYSGKTRMLPTAEYYKSSDASAAAIRDEAREAAESTGLKNIVLTVKSADWAAHFDDP